MTKFLWSSIRGPIAIDAGIGVDFRNHRRRPSPLLLKYCYFPKLDVNDADPMLTDWWSAGDSVTARGPTPIGEPQCVLIVCRRQAENPPSLRHVAYRG